MVDILLEIGGNPWNSVFFKAGVVLLIILSLIYVGVFWTVEKHGFIVNNNEKLENRRGFLGLVGLVFIFLTIVAFVVYEVDYNHKKDDLLSSWERDGEVVERFGKPDDYIEGKIEIHVGSGQSSSVTELFEVDEYVSGCVREQFVITNKDTVWYCGE